MNKHYEEEPYWKTVMAIAKEWKVSNIATREDARDIKEALGDLIYPVSAILLRLLATLLFPISIPLLAWLVRKDYRKRKAAHEAWLKERNDHIWGAGK